MQSYTVGMGGSAPDVPLSPTTFAGARRDERLAVPALDAAMAVAAATEGSQSPSAGANASPAPAAPACGLVGLGQANLVGPRTDLADEPALLGPI